MFWLSGFVCGEAVDRSIDDFADSLSSFHAAMIAPCGNHHAYLRTLRSKSPIIPWPNGIAGGSHYFGICRPKTKGVHHDQATVAPVFGESNTTTNGRVVLRFIRSRGIQADEHQLVCVPPPIPTPPKRISIGAASGKLCTAFKVLIVNR